jgi:hypothetical protein
MAKIKKSKPPQPKFNRVRLLIAVAALGLVVLIAAGWFITRQMMGDSRAPALQQATPLLAQLTQKVETTIGQTKIARQEAQLAAESQNLDVVQLHVHRLYNIIVGQHDGYYDAAVGDPGDGTGIVKHFEELLALLDDARVRQATAALGPSLESKRQQVSMALENARADVLGSQLHAKGAFKDTTLDAAQQDVHKAIGWLDSAISDTPESTDPQTQTLYFAQALLREIARAVNPKG